jgi:transcriptional regulator with XRE-family HTH domain
MYFKQLRKSKHLSQEELAEKCKLGIRTIQRVESGHRVGYATLRALAKFFECDVDDLERKLYAVNKETDEFREIPYYVRFILGRGWGSVNRLDSIKIEILLVVQGLICFAVWLCISQSIVLYVSFSQFVGASVMSLSRALGDEFKVWSAIDKSHSGGIFGFFKTK